MGKRLSKAQVAPPPPVAAAGQPVDTNRRRSSTPPALDMVTLRRKSEEFERQLEQDMLLTRRYEEIKRTSSRKDLRRSCGTATPSPKTPTPRSFTSVMKDDPNCAVVELLFVVMESMRLNDAIIIKPTVSSHDDMECPHPFLLCINKEHYFPVVTHKSAISGKWQASATIKL